MASFELCTDRMSVFMGSDKPSRFCNYYIEPHLPTSCGTFTFGGRMRPRAKTSSREQGLDFNLVGTCEWLSYMRASGSQVYGVLVRFFPLHGVYRFESPRHSRLWVVACRCRHLVVCLVYCWRMWGVGYAYGHNYSIIMVIVFTYLWRWHGSTFCLFTLVLVYKRKHNIWLN
jgi:hypothetical protein